MACTVWVHFMQQEEDIRAKQNYDWLVRFPSKQEAVNYSREIFNLCQVKLNDIMNSVDSNQSLISDFPDEVARLCKKKNTIPTNYRYWHDDLAPLVCLWDHVGYVNTILDGTLGFEEAGNDGFFNLGSIRSETLSFDLNLGDEFFVPPNYYYNKIAYFKPTDVSNMFYIYPSVIGTPESYFIRSCASHVEREEPYDFTRPEPNEVNLDRELDAYMQRV
jgi:hypothetical protein